MLPISYIRKYPLLDRIFLQLGIHLFLLLLIIPIININSIHNPTIASKTIFFIYGLVVILLIQAVKFPFTKSLSIPIRVSKIDLVFLAFISFLIINRYFIQEYSGFSLKYIELLGLNITYLSFRSTDLKYYPWYFLAILISGIIQTIWGILQSMDFTLSSRNDGTMSGSFFNPGLYAGFLATVGVLSTGMYLLKNKFLTLVGSRGDERNNILKKLTSLLFRYIPFLCMLSVIIVLPSTRSRASWLAFIGGAFILIVSRTKVQVYIKKLTSISKLLVGIGTAVFIGIFIYGLYNYKHDSAFGRQLIWKVSSKIIEDHPITGVGYDRFKTYYMENQAQYFVGNADEKEKMVADNTYYAFNEPIQITVETGLIGFILIVVLGLLLILTKTNSEHRYLKFLSLGVLGSIFINGLFSYPSQNLPIKLFIVLFCALVAKIDINHLGSSARITRIIGGIPVLGRLIVVLPVLLIITSLVFYKIRIIETAYKNWEKGSVFSNYNLFEDSNIEFEKAYETLGKEGDFLINYGKSLTLVPCPEKTAIDIGNIML